MTSMQTYHKISTPYKRHKSGRYKDKLIIGDWARPEFEYLAKNQWEFTEKIDGTNIRVVLSRIKDSLVCHFAGRTDGAQIKAGLRDALRELFPNSPSGDGAAAHIGRWMVDNDLETVTLYGEGVGPGIHGGGNYIKDGFDFILFDVNIGGFWLDRDNVNDVAEKLHLERVPVLGYGTLDDAVDIVTIGLGPGVDGRTKSFSGSLKSGLESRWGGFEAEGIVARPVVPLFNRKGERIVVKIKGRDFK
jgi:hypothetical protein